ncbi:MAG TPA: hypothetical protein VMY37_25585, partial [Thermoguttaceae bacterium]|nr:hypothetical protein [Thermoguttaceae bacterium]
ALDDTEREYGPVTLGGRFAFVSVDDEGKPRQAYLLAGTLLSYGDVKLALPKGMVPLKMQSVTDRTFHLAEPLPPDLTAEGLYVLAGETGYEIESTTADTVTVRDYPAVDCQEIRVLNAAWMSGSQ